MLKMLLDPMGGVLITNDGHAILREIDVAHPAAKSMIDICGLSVFCVLICLLCETRVVLVGRRRSVDPERSDVQSVSGEKI
jgi:hypothetical protein